MPLLKRLIRDYVAKHLAKLLLAFVCMALVAATTAAHAWMMQPVLDDIFLKQDQEMLVLIPAFILIVAIVKAVATYGQSVLMRMVGQRVVTDMQHDLYRHLMVSDLALFHRQSSGTLLSRFTNDIMLLRESCSSVLTGLAKEFLTVLFLIGVMVYQSLTLSLIALVVVPLAIYPVRRLGRRMRKISTVTQEGLGGLTSHLEASFQGIRIVRAFGQEAKEMHAAGEHIEGVYRQYIKAFRVKSAISPIMELLAGCAIAAVVWYGGSEVIRGGTTPGSFFSFMTALIMAYKPMKSLASINTVLQEGLAAAQRLFDLLDRDPTIRDLPDAKPLMVKKGHIRFEGVSFAYADQPVLHDVTLDIPPGAKVALVGPSGSGKSTIANLLLRFYEPQSGHIRIDGQDIHQVTQQSLRQAIGIVTQETVLFDSSVAANIGYGLEQPDMQRIKQAAKDADADTFIEALPQGYETPIGQMGMRLSGGQRQRLAIARAMACGCPIMVLDEATSALDPVAEQAIQAALLRLMERRTSLVIAHRLSTICDADHIYVLDHGRVVEDGTHEALMAKGGVYHALYASQHEAGRPS